MSKSPKQAMDVHSVVSADPRIKFVAENICKSCRKKHTANCCSEYCAATDPRLSTSLMPDTRQTKLVSDD